MALSGTTTGTAGTTVAAQCATVQFGSEVESGDTNAIAQSIENDIATIASGNMTFAGTKSFSSPMAYNPAQAVTRTLIGHWFVLAGGWTVDDAVYFGAPISSNNTGDQVAWELDLPHGAVLTDIGAAVLPASGHSGLPGTQPRITLFVQPYASGTTTQVATVLDAQLNKTAYETRHTFDLTGSPITTIDRSANRYVLAFQSELSTNALSGLTLICMRCTYSISTVGLG